MDERTEIVTFEEEHELQSKLLYSIIVAGKSANFTDRALAAFLDHLADERRYVRRAILPFDMISECSDGQLRKILLLARTGNYGKIERAFSELASERLNLLTCKPADLEKIHGIGPKTSRFFIIWSRPNERYAALDVHVLRWLSNRGWPVPKNTPQSSKKYALIEQWFFQEADKLGKTPRELDEEIWAAGAGRTQESALPG